MRVKQRPLWLRASRLFALVLVLGALALRWWGDGLGAKAQLMAASVLG